jgi:hypothetical protein
MGEIAAFADKEMGIRRTDSVEGLGVKVRNSGGTKRLNNLLTLTNGE